MVQTFIKRVICWLLKFETPIERTKPLFTHVSIAFQVSK